VRILFLRLYEQSIGEWVRTMARRSGSKPKMSWKPTSAGSPKLCERGEGRGGEGERCMSATVPSSVKGAVIF
jgi:hypothetical protein